MRHNTQWLGAVSAIALVAMSSTPALAVGTAAGTDITNNVSVSFQVGGENQTAVTDSDTFTVDRRIDVNVNFTGATPVSVSPGQDRAALAFDVTNLSNAAVDFDLSTVLINGTSANISNYEIYLDANGDGILDAGELAAGPINFLDEVAADGIVSVIVVADIDTNAVDGDIFDVVLVADAHEAGDVGTLGAEIFDTAGANTAGVDTVLADGNGGTGEDADLDGAYSDVGQFEVAGAVISVVKSSRIISDPVNGISANAKAIPGAVIEYCIAVTNGVDAATATSVVVSDDLPADVTFTPGGFGIFVNGTATIDNSGPTPVATCSGGANEEGGDAIYAAGLPNTITGSLADIPASTTTSLYFRVTIK